MIRSFADKETERIWNEEHSRRLPRDVQQQALRKLAILNRVSAVEQVRHPPGNRLEKLHGDRAGQWSIRINSQWRLCFVWESGDAVQVEITDYH